MAITAASVEANGWVLAITHNRGLGTFASYALSPDASPALTLTSQHPGFDVSGGVAFANAVKPRNFIGTKPLRQAAIVSNAGVLSAKTIDETDNGGGSVTVRIALSSWIYATDKNLTLTAAANWRTGEAAATIAVTNNSTVVCPAPIHRWADVPYRLQRGSFDVDMLVFGFFPQGTQPVAGVKFTVTDGTTVKTFWSTALSTSTQFGDNLRVYRVTVDPTTATALTTGLLRVDAEVYPWIGAMRPTDPAGTKAMGNLRGDGWSGKAQAPFVVAYDPTGARYHMTTVYVDYTNGSTTPATGMVATATTEAASLTAAKAVAPAARAKDVLTALQAVQLTSPWFPGTANGQASDGGFHVFDGVRIVLAPQVHAGGLGLVTGVAYGAATLETYARVEGDPADPNPRANCVLQTVTGDSNASKVSRFAFSNMSVELGNYIDQYCPYWWLDNVELRGRSGQTTSIHAATGGNSPTTGDLSLHFTRSRLWKTGIALDSRFGQTCRAKLIRGTEHRRAAEAAVCVKNRAMLESEDTSFTGSDSSAWMTGAVSSLGLDLPTYDSIVAYGDYRGIRGQLWNGGSLPASATANPVYALGQHRRQVFFGNIGERIGNSPDKMFGCGEQEGADMAECIVEANTVVGERVNWGYNDSGAGATVAATDAQAQNSYVSCRVAGNMLAAHFTKHDRFDDPSVKQQRVNAGDPRSHGIRPYNTNCYASLYGVGQRDNVDLAQTNLGVQPEAFNHEYEGLNCRFDLTPIDPKFAADKSRWRLATDYSSTAVGGGDYTPLAASPAVGRVASGNSDRDGSNTPRPAAFAAGAIEAATVVVTSLVPATTRHSSLVATNTVSSWRSGTMAPAWRAPRPCSLPLKPSCAR